MVEADRGLLNANVYPTAIKSVDSVHIVGVCEAEYCAKFCHVMYLGMCIKKLALNFERPLMFFRQKRFFATLS